LQQELKSFCFSRASPGLINVYFLAFAKKKNVATKV
jgi:hypothetical protein